jgi:hypothetical protein
MNDVVTTSTTPLSNIERLIRWRSEYTRLTADVDNWLRVIGYTATPRTKMLALPPPAQKSNNISAYLRGGI